VTADNCAQQIQAKLGETWLPRIYRERILPLRTRSYHLEKAKPAARIDIQHTLLGVELKIGRKRLLCPDLATARYLSVFARVGATDVAVPYDITKISHIADELESSWHRMLLLVDQETGKESPRLRSRVRGLLIAQVRTEMSAAGAGTRIPEFKEIKAQKMRLTTK
jgi:hypothetical protein